MKIALFVHCFFPDHFYGTETYTLEVARNLREMGHDPVVISAVSRSDATREKLITRYSYQSIPVVLIDTNRFPNKRVKDSYHQPLMRSVVAQVLEEVRPDIVHVTHLANHTAEILDVFRGMKLPAIATLTDFFGICLNSHLTKADGSLCGGPNKARINCIECFLKAIHDNRKRMPTFAWLKSGFLRLNFARLLSVLEPVNPSTVVADIKMRPEILLSRYQYYKAVVSPTRFLASAYIENGLSSRIHHIHFGIDMPHVKKSPVAPGAPLRFGFIGQLAHHKGPDILIDAFCRLPKGSAELNIFGSGGGNVEYESELRRRADRYPIEFHGTFPGEDIAKIFANLDFLVIPSRWYENSPLVLLGALSSHTPVIVSDVDGMAEFVKVGVDGFLFRRGSADDLESVLRKLIVDAEGSRGMSEETKYPRTTRHMTEDLVAVYESVLDDV